jgi:hypothetical protein
MPATLRQPLRKLERIARGHGPLLQLWRRREVWERCKSFLLSEQDHV